MIKFYFLASVFSILAIGSFAQSPFTKGNLVVYKVGNGTDSLSSAGAAVTLDEFTTSGTFVQSHPLPTTLSGNNKRIIASGSASSEGQITRSVDKKYILVTGYDTIPDPTRLKIPTSTTANVNRVVGVIGLSGVLDATTALTDAYSGGNIRAVASTDGTDIWVAGSSSGIRYTTIGSTTSTLVSSTVANNRTVNIFNGQLYSSSASSTFLGVCQDGTGTPTTGGQTITLLPGFPSTASTPSPSSYGFSVSPASDVIYVADDRAAATAGGVQKWTFDGTNWNLAYTMVTGLATGTRGITVDWSGANPVIYATTTEQPFAGAHGNKIVTVIDTGALSPFTILDSADINYVYRGIAFAPESFPTPVTLLSFKAASVTAGVQVQWATSREINSKEFEVSKSTDGTNYTSIGKITASGTSSFTHNYSLLDPHPFNGVNYYKLKSIDKSGTYSYSNVVTVNYAGKDISIFPNPAQGIVTINHPSANKGVLELTDVLGKKLQTINVSHGATSSTINLNGLSKGQYFLKFVDVNYSNVTVLHKL